MQIAQEIDAHIDHERVEVVFELDRKKATRLAIEASTATDVVVLAGRGEDKYLKVKGEKILYHLHNYGHNQCKLSREL